MYHMMTKNKCGFMLYYDACEVTTLDFPIACAKSHTMGKQLSKWAWSKVPKKAIEEVIQNDITIEVHGVYPNTPTELLTHYGGSVDVEQIDFTPTSRKQLNYVRPAFSLVNHGKTLLVKVTPGKDYLYHYSGIIRHCLHQYDRVSLLKIYRYPHIEVTIDEWTMLDNKFITQDAVVIMGYVEEAELYLTMHLNNLSLFRKSENAYYTATQYRASSGQMIIFLGVKYSFWGDISARIVRKFCKLGVKEVIYISKLGSLRTPNDIYNFVFSPTKYITLGYCDIKNVTETTLNNIAAMFPELNTHCHVSVPTVIGEDLVQRSTMIQYGACSIDNEISQMAHAISNFNKMSHQQVCFSSLHFASDYLRKSAEVDSEIAYDLSNNRSKKALKQKTKMMQVLLSYLTLYIQSTYN